MSCVPHLTPGGAPLMAAVRMPVCGHCGGPLEDDLSCWIHGDLTISNSRSGR